SVINPRPRRSTPFPYTTLFRSPPASSDDVGRPTLRDPHADHLVVPEWSRIRRGVRGRVPRRVGRSAVGPALDPDGGHRRGEPAVDRKSTRLNSSHVKTSYAVFC